MNNKYKLMSTKEIERDIADEALLVQNACNLSGVVYGFARVMDAICELSHRNMNQGTEFKNTHPVVVLFANKIDSLSSSSDNFTNAYNWCCEKTGKV